MTPSTPLAPLLLLLASALSLPLLVACGSDGAATPDAGAPPADAAATASLTVHVPTDMVGVPERFYVIASETAPVAGPPAAILHLDDAPTLAPGDSVSLDLDLFGVEGSYYVVVVVYVEGGGTFTPAAGLDYVAYTSAPVAFDGSPHALGTLDLALAE